MKIVIYGAGRVGTTAALNLMQADACHQVEIVLYSPHNHKRCEGALMDMEDACALRNITSKITFKATSNVADLANADAVVVCSEGLPSREMYADAAAKGVDDRLVQAAYGINQMKQFAAVAEQSPNAVIFVAAKPVDMMCEVLRTLLPQRQIYGLGCWLDTARFKRELLPQLLAEFKNLQLSDINAFVIGHHNGTMFLHENSFAINGLPYRFVNRVELAIRRTKGRELNITETNCKAATKVANNSSYFAIARMVSDVLAAFIGGEAVLPMNRQVLRQESAELAGNYAQLLCRVSQGKVEELPMSLASSDIVNLKHCFEVQAQDKQKLEAYIKN